MRTIACVVLALCLAGCGADYSGGGGSSAEDAAAWGVLGGTAFLNGYNQARQQPVTCYHTGMMTQCY